MIRRQRFARLVLLCLWFGLVVLGMGVLFNASQAVSAEPATSEPVSASAKEDRQGAEFFESKIRPLLAARCFECHGPEKQKGGLRLDSRVTLIEGGDSGPAVVPGKPEESLLASVVRYNGDIKMPPKSKLPDHEIALLAEWIKRGRLHGRISEAIAAKKPLAEGPLFTAEQKAFWAFQPVVDPPAPPVRNSSWVKIRIGPVHPLLNWKAKVSSQPPRRQTDLDSPRTFDLTGVPPTPAEINAFLADDSADAFAKVVDRLLASTRYGERWGRHWLDIARYADSNGLDENLAYASAYLYRDYVVSAFNRGQAAMMSSSAEQLAGDLLPPSNDRAIVTER